MIHNVKPGDIIETDNPDCIVDMMIPGMVLRDWFAATIQYDKSIMEDVGACDDQDLLERYGTEAEKDDGFRCVLPNGPMPIVNIILRQRLESRARAELRYIESDAMLEARKRRE